MTDILYKIIYFIYNYIYFYIYKFLFYHLNDRKVESEEEDQYSDL